MKSNLTAAALAVLAICTAALVVRPASGVAQQPSTAMPSNQMMEQHHMMMQGQSDVATDPQQVQHIRGLGFIGVMVSGSHHQAHHLAMAKGEFVHSQ